MSDGISDSYREMEQRKRDEKAASKIIAEMQAAGLTPDDMLRVIALAREKFNEMKKE